MPPRWNEGCLIRVVSALDGMWERPTLDEWQSELANSFLALTGADCAYVVLPSAAAPPTLFRAPRHTALANEDFLTERSVGIARMRQAGMGAWAFDDLTLGAERIFRESRDHERFFGPNAQVVRDAAGLLVPNDDDSPRGAIGLFSSKPHELSVQRHLLGHLVPRFRNLLRDVDRRRRWGSREVFFLETLGIPSVWSDLSGRHLARTTAATRLLDTDTEGPAIRAALAESVATLARSELRYSPTRKLIADTPANEPRAVRTPRGVYQLRSSYGPAADGGRRTVLTVIEPMTLLAPRTEDLLDHFTNREVEAIRLRAMGQTEAKIALAMHVDEDTVTKHLQHARERVGVHRTSDLVEIVQGLRRLPPEPSRRRRPNSGER